MENKVVKVGAIAFAAAILGCVVLSPVQAQSTYFVENNKTIAKLGVQGNMFYTYFSEPMGQNCLNGVLYISSDRKALYTQLLAAKLSGKHISRVDYSQPAGNGTTCTVELVEISE